MGTNRNDAFPPEYLEGLRLFNEGRYWEAHEALERVWLRAPKGSDERRFYQGLIQISAAFLHRERAARTRARSSRAAVRCCRSGLEKLDSLPDRYMGLDLAALRPATRRCLEPLASGADPAGLPPAPSLVARA